MKNIPMKNILKLMILLLCCMMGMAGAEQDRQSLYAQQLQADPRAEAYYVMDINMDGSPELLIRRGTCEADMELAVYTVRDGQAEELGVLPFSHGTLCDLYGTTSMLVMHAHMGVEAVTVYELEGGILSETVSYELEHAPGEPYTDYVGETGCAPEDLSALTLWTAETAADNGNTELLNLMLTELELPCIAYM